MFVSALLILRVAVVCADDIHMRYHHTQIELKSEFMGMTSLVFVFDVTGSMSNELDQVKRGASKILEEIAGNKNKIIYDYILVPFNDPQVGPAIKTANASEFKVILFELSVSGGADCPEMTLTAIKESLQKSLSDSFIFVFTDADPKDAHLLDEILFLIREKRSQIIFVLTGNCVDDQNAEEFQKIAAISTGQIFNIVKNDVHLVLEFIRLSLRSHRVNLLAVDSKNGTNSSNSFVIPVDETVLELTISLTGKKTIISVTHLSAENYNVTSNLHSILNLENVKVINIQNPKAGLWKVSVSSVSAFSLRTTGSSNVNFIYSFSINETSYMNETSHQPFEGIENHIFLKPSDSSHIVNLFSCEIVALNGTVMDVVSLQKVFNVTNLYFGSFIPINGNFHLQVSGISKKGFIFRRITPSAFHPQQVAVNVTALPRNQTFIFGRFYSLSCKVESMVPFEIRWFKDGVLLNNTKKFLRSGVNVLEFPALSFVDKGNYTCLVLYGNETKTTFTDIRVLGLPVVTQNLPNQITLKANEDFGIPCSADGYPVPNITWIFNHSQILRNDVENENLLLLPNGILVFLNTLINQTGIYSCVVQNEVGTDHRHYQIVVVDDHKFENNVTVIKVNEGENACLSCPDYGDDFFAQWLKDYLPVDMRLNDRADEPRFILRNNGKQLKIINAYLMDVGRYTCVLSGVNETLQHHILLQVLIPPFLYDFRNTVHIVVMENGNATLDCRVGGYPTPSIIWKKEHLPWPVNQWTLPNVTLHMRKQTMIIRNVHRETHVGKYECIAKNEVSYTNRYFILKIEK